MESNSIKNKSLLIFIFLINISLIICGSENDVYLERSKRQLLFPNSTILQFNAGVGTPSPVKNVNVNWAFQANFQLPWNRTQIPVDILHANDGIVVESRKIRETDNMNLKGYQNNAKLFHFYKFIEDVLNGFGHNGKTCVLKTLCELGTVPLHSDYEEDLIHEVLSFALTPSNDISEHDDNKEAMPYIVAHNVGKRSNNCDKIYSDCTFQLSDMFSKIHNV